MNRRITFGKPGATTSGTVTIDPTTIVKTRSYDINDDPVLYSDLIQTANRKPAIVMDTAPYADGDCMGGLITLSNLARVAAGSGDLIRLQARTVLNMSAQMFVHIFDANPTVSTFTDNAALVIHANDRDKLLKTIAISAAGDWVAPKGASPWYTFELTDPSAGRLALPYELASARELYLAFEADGVIDFVAASDFGVQVGAWNN